MYARELGAWIWIRPAHGSACSGPLRTIDIPRHSANLLAVDSHPPSPPSPGGVGQGVGSRFSAVHERCIDSRPIFFSQGLGGEGLGVRFKPRWYPRHVAAPILQVGHRHGEAGIAVNLQLYSTSKIGLAPCQFRP